MSRAARWWVGTVVVGTALFVGTIGMTVAAVYGAGTVDLQHADREGNQVSVRVPAGLIHLAILLAPAPILQQAAEDLEPWMLPALRAGWNELSRTPDFVLLEINGADEHVRVEKRGKRLLVDVDNDGERFEFALPMKTVDRLLSKVERADDRPALAIKVRY